MPRNKNQHFVPQFYLRNFASDQDRRSINVFNIARSRLIERASIRNQCSRNYWHGDHDEVFEKGLSDLEGIGARTIKETINSERIRGLRNLMTFLMLQLGRTTYTAEAYAEYRRKAYELVYRQASDGPQLDPRHNISLYLTNSPFILDLAACLVVNQTEVDFITCDNPVVLHNWWFHNIYRQRPGSGIGLAHAGLEIYLPLSPRQQLILYDRNIWSVPKSNSDGTVVLRNLSDVVALNERQFLNADHNVYFSSRDTSMHVEELAISCMPRRRSSKVRVVEFVQAQTHHQKFVAPSSPEASPSRREALIMNEAIEISPRSRVSLFSKRFKPRYCDHPSVVGALRDFAWMRIVEDFRAELESGRLGLADLDQFAADHPLIFSVGDWKHEFWTTRRAG